MFNFYLVSNKDFIFFKNKKIIFVLKFDAVL